MNIEIKLHDYGNEADPLKELSIQPHEDDFLALSVIVDGENVEQVIVKTDQLRLALRKVCAR